MKMAEEAKNDVKEFVTSAEKETKGTKKKKGILSRLWGAIFRLHGDDFEKRLQYITKEEAIVVSRIARRSQSWKRMNRHLIIISVLFEAIAISYAIMTTRSLHLNWKMRAVRVLPMFLLPALSFLIYFTLRSFTRIFDQKDHKTLNKLRAERQSKIDELKEKTNYYITQQLIQKYDSDPAAKAAAATVLASKLGADSGLKLYVGDDSKHNNPTGKSNDVEVPTNTGLRNRKPSLSNDTKTQNASGHQTEAMGFDGADMAQQHQTVVEHLHPQAGSQNGGWIARLAAVLVGEDPTQSYALICGNCHMHNGLARKEDFLYVTYYCPHCNALNKPKLQHNEQIPGFNSSTITSSSVENTDAVPVPDGDTNSVSNNPSTSRVSESSSALME